MQTKFENVQLSYCHHNNLFFKESNQIHVQSTNNGMYNSKSTLDDIASLIENIIFFGGIFIILIYSKSSKTKKKRNTYLPPVITTEVSRINRELTGIEAAVVMELPLSRIFTMIILALLKKGVVILEPGNPIKVKKVEGIRKDVYLKYYERAVLRAISEDGTINKNKLKNALVLLIRTVSDKVGSARLMSQNYYNKLVRLAYKRLSEVKDPKLQLAAFDKYIEWILIDKNLKGKSSFLNNMAIPAWYWNFYNVVYLGASTSSSTGTPHSDKETGLMPDIAESFLSGSDMFVNAVVPEFNELENSIKDTFNAY